MVQKRMKPTGGENQGAPQRQSKSDRDPLTTILVGVALVLTAAIAAIAVDVWLLPVAENSVTAIPTLLPSRRPATPAPSQSTTSPSPPPGPSPTPAPRTLPTPATYAAPVRIRVPTLGIDRPIVEVPLTYDVRSKTWKRDYDRLFRRGKQDLVGHHSDSAAPGQPGNTILVGHNYGYGVNAVFQRLGRLKIGQQVEVVNDTGRAFTYRVTSVRTVPWTKKTQQELSAHQLYLAVDGPERLTLVTCGGSSWAPFPNRVYVVAEPAP
jgi:LPXTG-site transpeptidase (sortase) family protein